MHSTTVQTERQVEADELHEVDFAKYVADLPCSQNKRR